MVVSDNVRKETENKKFSDADGMLTDTDQVLHPFSFYSHNAMLVRVLAVTRCLSV